MSAGKTTRWLRLGLGAVALPLLGLGLAHSQNGKADKVHVVKVVAQRFNYTPNEIVLKTGQPARLEFTSKDFVHGFKVPDLDIRADLPPGRVTVVEVTPQKAGVYDFLCDNFCGSGHEQMEGRIVVKD